MRVCFNSNSLTLTTVTMSDGQPAGDRVEYFAAVQETEVSTDGSFTFIVTISKGIGNST